MNTINRYEYYYSLHHFHFSFYFVFDGDYIKDNRFRYTFLKLFLEMRHYFEVDF